MLAREANEPMLPMESTEPTDPTDSNDPVEAMESTEFREAMLQRDCAGGVMIGRGIDGIG